MPIPRDVPFTPGFLTVKLIDIGLVTVYYFVLGVAIAKVFDVVYGKFNMKEYDEKSDIRIFLEIVGHLFILGIVAYVLRNIVDLIPFPLDGAFGFQHNRLKELGGGIVLPIILIMFQDNLINKISYFVKRVAGISTVAQ